MFKPLFTKVSQYLIDKKYTEKGYHATLTINESGNGRLYVRKYAADKSEEGLFNKPDKKQTLELITKEQIKKLYNGMIYICNQFKSGSRLGDSIGIGNNSGIEGEEYPLFWIDIFTLAKIKKIDVSKNFEIPNSDSILKDTNFDKSQQDDPMYYLWFKFAMKIIEGLTYYLKKQNLFGSIELDWESDKYEDMQCSLKIIAPIKEFKKMLDNQNKY